MIELLKSLKSDFFRIVLGLVFLGFEGLGAYLLINVDNSSKAIIAISAGIVCLFFIFLSRFKHFEAKWLGIKGELWEEKQKEAIDLIKQLKNISPALAACSYSSLIAVGRFAGAIPNDARFQMAEELQEKLTEIGVPARKVKEARKHFDRLLLVDMAGPLWDKTRKHLWNLESDLGRSSKPHNDPEYLEQRRAISTELQRCRELEIDFRNNNYDVLDRLFGSITSSKHLPADWLENLKQEFKLQIENIKAYVERGEIPHPEAAFKKED